MTDTVELTPALRLKKYQAYIVACHGNNITSTTDLGFFDADTEDEAIAKASNSDGAIIFDHLTDEDCEWEIVAKLESPQ